MARTYSDTDSSEVSDVDLDIDGSGNVLPYQFEPRVSGRRPLPRHDLDYMSDEDDGNVDDRQADRCTCTNCIPMTNEEENRCCHDSDFDEVRGDELCITAVRAFQLNCLEIDVVRLGVYDHISEYGFPGDNEPRHKIFRHVAYRRFIRCVFGLLPKKDRRVIPSCVVRVIRQTFPSETYTGFKYPELA